MIKDWKKLGWNNTLSKGGMMWGNSKKGGMIFISKSNSEWRFGGINGRGYFKESKFKTKSATLQFVKAYMRKH